MSDWSPSMNRSPHPQTPTCEGREVSAYTEDDYAEGAKHYGTLTVPQLRRYQEIVQAQIPLAFKQRNEAALAHLQRVDDLVSAEIYLKSFL